MGADGAARSVCHSKARLSLSSSWQSKPSPDVGAEPPSSGRNLSTDPSVSVPACHKGLDRFLSLRASKSLGCFLCGLGEWLQCRLCSWSALGKEAQKEQKGSLKTSSHCQVQAR